MKKIFLKISTFIAKISILNNWKKLNPWGSMLTNQRFFLNNKNKNKINKIK
jgi:hypothetical protein